MNTRVSHVAVLVGSVLSVALAAGGWRAAAALAIVGGVGLGVVTVDLAQRRIPTRIVFTGAGALIAAVLVDAIRDSSIDGLVVAALGGVVVGGAFLVIYLWRPAAIGFGDVRLATVIGAAVAWGGDDLGLAVAATAAASVAAALYMVITRTRSIPFAPCLVPAAVVAIVAAALA